MVDSTTIEPSLESILVVWEFSNVFPEEIPGMPLLREVDFCIDLAVEVSPISKAPYRIALVELKKLKTQLDELAEKEYIRLSTSLWGALVLFCEEEGW